MYGDSPHRGCGGPHCRYAHSYLLLTLTVDGVPCSALDGHVETPPERVEGDTGSKLTVICSLH